MILFVRTMVVDKEISDSFVLGCATLGERSAFSCYLLNFSLTMDRQRKGQRPLWVEGKLRQQFCYGVMEHELGSDLHRFSGVSHVTHLSPISSTMRWAEEKTA